MPTVPPTGAPHLLTLLTLTVPRVGPFGEAMGTGSRPGRRPGTGAFDQDLREGEKLVLKAILLGRKTSRIKARGRSGYPGPLHTVPQCGSGTVPQGWSLFPLWYQGRWLCLVPWFPPNRSNKPNRLACTRWSRKVPQPQGGLYP